MTSKMMAELQGLADYPFVLVKHPIGSLTDELLNEQAVEAAERIERILLHGKTKVMDGVGTWMK